MKFLKKKGNLVLSLQKWWKEMTNFNNNNNNLVIFKVNINKNSL